MRTYIALLCTGLLLLFTIVYIGSILFGFGLFISFLVATACILAVLLRVSTYKPPLVFNVQSEIEHPIIATILFVVCVLTETLLLGIVLGFGTLLAIN